MYAIGILNIEREKERNVQSPAKEKNYFLLGTLERTVSRKTMSDVSGSFCQFWKRRDFWRFKVSQPVCGGSRRLQSKMIIHDPSDNKR